MNILFVEPEFPRASKSKNHNKFMPIGLLKLASYHRKKGDSICIVRGQVPKEEIYFEHLNGSTSKNKIPSQIFITSYFTYWSKYVKVSVQYYRKLFPRAKTVVGGIYASLMPEHCKKYTGCDEVFVGIHEKAELTPISFRYLEKYYGSVDYQIIHTSRGCIRRCEFCGVYKIEPKFTYKKSIGNEIQKKKIIFYDNNLLANPCIENILAELAYLKSKNKIQRCESQSGIDGRILEKNPDLAYLLKKAGFKNIRISWDGPLSDASHVHKQLKILKKVGYNLHEDVFIFMIYNWDISFEEMEKKRIKCWEWKVQITDCRYRPLNQTYDRYNGQKYRKGQTSRDYYIHKKAGWTDNKIRTFRKHIRRQNICTRLNILFYTNTIERKYLSRVNTRKLVFIARNYPKEELKVMLSSMKIPFWFPDAFNGKFSEFYVSKAAIYEDFVAETNKKVIVKNQESYNFKKWRNKHINQELDKVIIDCRAYSF